MLSYFRYHLSDNYDLSDLYVVLSDAYDNVSDLYVSCSVNAVQITIKLSENRHNI